MRHQLPKEIHTQQFANGTAVAEAAADYILNAAQQAIRLHGRFKFVLAGGTTPQAAYHLLAMADAEWSRWHIYYGDERCLPAEDHQRNSHMAAAAWLDHVAIPRKQIHPIHTEYGAERAAFEYNTLIGDAVPFDLVLLGMGEDGHTASLFPGQQHALHYWVVPVHNAPKPPPDRVSLTARALSKTRALLLLVTGAAKHEALMRWCSGETLPVATVVAMRDHTRSVELLLDDSAAGG